MSSTTATWRDWSCSVAVTVTEPRTLDRARTIVRDLMAEVDRAASRFRDDSQLELINRNSGVLVPVGSLTYHLVQVALDAACDTAGAVDPTAGTDLIRIGYDRDIAHVRERKVEVSPRRPERTSWQQVRMESALRRIGVPRGTRLDLGATAKAWAADEAARRVHRAVGGAVLVGIGGDLATAGNPGRDWRIDVMEVEGPPSARIGLSRGGIATSSVVGRQWTSATGATLHHVVDPSTGLPATGPWRTATVWGPSALAANVMSTWVLVDSASAVRQIEARGMAARLVRRDGVVAAVGSWPHDQGPSGSEQAVA